MKLIIIVACYFLIVNGQLDQVRENFKHLLGACKEIVGASDVDVDQYVHSITPDTDAGKCLIACVNKKIKIQDPNGKINPDAARDSTAVIKGIDEKWYRALVIINEKCLAEVVDGPDECELGAQWFACVSKGQKDAGLPLVLVDE